MERALGVAGGDDLGELGDEELLVGVFGDVVGVGILDDVLEQPRVGPVEERGDEKDRQPRVLFADQLAEVQNDFGVGADFRDHRVEFLFFQGRRALFGLGDDGELHQRVVEEVLQLETDELVLAEEKHSEDSASDMECLRRCHGIRECHQIPSAPYRDVAPWLPEHGAARIISPLSPEPRCKPVSVNASRSFPIYSMCQDGRLSTPP